MEFKKILRKAQNKVNRIIAITTTFPIKSNWRQLKTIHSFSPENYIRDLNKPIFYVWGEEDRLVYPEWCTNELHRIFGPNEIPSHFTIFTVPKANHSFWEYLPTKQRSHDAIEAVNSWLVSQNKISSSN